MDQDNKTERRGGKPLAVINIGISTFYEALVEQDVKAVQLDWRPPVRQSEAIENLLDMLL